MKVSLNDNVKRDNLDSEGKLQPGNYNVRYHGVRSFAPLFRVYDGETWEGLELGKWSFVEEDSLTQDELDDWSADIMFVYVRETK